MDAMDFARRYFAAWNKRDAGAVLETIAPHGTYQDPTTPGPLAGQALQAWMRQLWAAFPDLSFELARVHAVGDGIVHGEWTMHGTNSGSFHGLPPTGRAVRLPGLDVIEAGPDGITSIRGYFDSAQLPRQLGLDVVVQPRQAGPLQLGVSSSLRRGLLADAQALVVTELVAGSDEGVARIRDLARDIVGEQLAHDDLLSFTGTAIGRRLTTITTWTSAQRMREAMRRGAHARAMAEFFESPAIEGGSIGLFARTGEGPRYGRCPACGRMAAIAAPTGACACGQVLQPLA